MAILAPKNPEVEEYFPDLVLRHVAGLTTSSKRVFETFIRRSASSSRGTVADRGGRLAAGQTRH